MPRVMNILIIAEFFILNHVSNVLSRQLNLTQLIRSFDPEPNYHNLMARYIYLPEEHYDAENVAKKQLNRDNRNLMPEYRNLCETITKTVEILDTEHEHQPPYYHEVYCKGYSVLSEEERTMKRTLQQKCVHSPAFHCVQKSRFFTFARRRWDSECWEPYTREIASGCDCMWPVTNLGEISYY